MAITASSLLHVKHRVYHNKTFHPSLMGMDLDLSPKESREIGAKRGGNAWHFATSADLGDHDFLEEFWMQIL